MRIDGRCVSPEGCRLRRADVAHDVLSLNTRSSIMAFPFEVSEVVRPIQMNAQQAVTISLKLQRRAPSHAPKPVQERIKELHTCTEQLNEHQRTAVPPVPQDAQRAFRECVTAWSVLHRRLKEVSRLDGAEARQASALLEAVFPTGISIVRGEAEAVWVAGQLCLDRIAHGDHAEALDRMAGDFVVRAVRTSHRSLGVALELTGSVRPPARIETSGVSQRELVENIKQAIAAYALQMIAATNEKDEAAVQATTTALEPIIEFRAQSRARRSASHTRNQQGENNASESGGTAKPAKPTAPEKPATPEKPAAPVATATPATPVVIATPAVPVAPVTTETPAPVAPVVAATPTVPAAPTTPMAVPANDGSQHEAKVA
jgi:hypothetical protein